MTSLPGGGALRTGLYYEDMWLIRRVIDMLEGKATRIRLEPPGEAGTGIEFEIDIGDDTWGEQTKTGTRRWTTKRLRDKKVLSSAKTQISAGRRFRFIATTAAPVLSGLSSFAGKAESFADYKRLRLRESVGNGEVEVLG